MFSYATLKSIWPTLGARTKAALDANRNKSYTKKGPGRIHQQGKPKKR